MHRRQSCRGLVATGASALAVGSAAATESSDPVPGWVSTRGHFDIKWGVDDLTDGHTETDYRIEGTVPGYEGESPDDLAIMVHGFKHDEEWARQDFNDTAESLRKAGCDGEVGGFSWDSDGDRYDWWPIDDIAERNGPKLANFLRDYRQRNPETKIRLVPHSLGAKVVMKTFESLEEWDFEGTIDSVALLGAAVEEDAASTCDPWYDDRYGQELEAHAGQADNFWKSDDGTLDDDFEMAEWEAALGSHGLDGDAPENDEDHQVDYVKNHNAYFRDETGAAKAIVDQW